MLVTTSADIDIIVQNEVKQTWMYFLCVSSLRTCATLRAKIFSRPVRAWIPTIVTPIGHAALPIAISRYASFAYTCYKLWSSELWSSVEKLCRNCLVQCSWRKLVANFDHNCLTNVAKVAKSYGDRNTTCGYRTVYDFSCRSYVMSDKTHLKRNKVQVNSFSFDYSTEKVPKCDTFTSHNTHFISCQTKQYQSFKL